MINLRRKWYDIKYNNTITAQDLGIDYSKAVPQTMGEQTWYFNCQNVPEELPDGWSIIEGELEKFIGYGLSWDDVKELRAQHNGKENA